jgi:hypothetical protein
VEWLPTGRIGVIAEVTSAHQQPAAPWPDDVYQHSARRAGRRGYGLLLLEQQWVHRRVETIDLLSTQFLRRSISVDFTVPESVRDALRIGTTEQWLVPLATLAKRPLRHFDLRDEARKALPVLGRDHNGPLAHGALVGVARRALTNAGLGPPSPELQSELEKIATEPYDQAEQVIQSVVSAANGGDVERRALLQDDSAVFLISDLAPNYILLAICDDITTRRVLKFSYEEPLAAAKPSVLERLGWRSLLIELDAPGVSRTASYHAEIAIPEELRFDATFLYDRESGEVYAEDGEADRAAIHAAHVPVGAPGVLLFGVRAERTTFPVVGFAVAWITAGLLLIGAFLGDLEPTQAGPPISILLAASAVFAGAVARAGEHRLVQALFAGPRLLLVISALSALAAASSLAYGASAGTLCVVWKVAAATSVVVAAMLTLTLLIARPIVPGRQDDD